MKRKISESIVLVLTRLLRLSRPTKRYIALVMDAVLCVAAAWIAFSLRLGKWVGLEFEVFTTSLVALLLWYPIAWRVGIYRAIFRFGGAGTMLDILRSCMMLAVPMIAIFMLLGISEVPRTIGLLQPIIFLMLLVLNRAVVRYLFLDVLAQRTYGGPARNVLIYGAGSAGQQLALSMRQEPGLRLCGFVDDDRRLHGQILDGTRVYHTERLSELIKDYEISDVLLALPNLAQSRRNQIIEDLECHPVHVMTLPMMAQIVDGKVSVSHLRELRIEDLLGRDPVPPNELLMGRIIFGKKVLVTGAGGSIGSELCRQIIEQRPAQLVLVEMSEYALYAIERELRALTQSREQEGPELIPVLGNIADARVCASIFREYTPTTVFHAAAYKHVPLVESNPVLGVANNVLSTWNAANEAKRAGASHFILISTDKAVRPTNIMGASKRICELCLQALAAKAVEDKDLIRFAMVRFGNVLGSSGSVVPYFEKQIREGGPVTLTHRDITRYFMTIPEAAQLVIQAGSMASGGEVYVLDMGESVRIYDLAATMIRLSGLTVRDENNPDGDIEILEIGLRPGEKLYEELLIGTDAQETRHSRIMCAAENFLPLAELQPLLDALNDCIERDDRQGLLQVIRKLVPEYVPPHEIGTDQTADQMC